MQQLQQLHCPTCNSKSFSRHTTYTVQSDDPCKLDRCNDCDAYFSETKNTPLTGLRCPLSFIVMVQEASNEGSRYGNLLFEICQEVLQFPPTKGVVLPAQDQYVC